MFTHWPPRLSEFRLACVECHKRKIRCEPSLDGTKGLCEACQANNRPCLFSLRSKTGRPHKNDAGKQQMAGAAARPRSATMSLGGRGDGAMAHHTSPPPSFDQAATSPGSLVPPWKHSTSDELNFIFQGAEGASSVPLDEKKQWLKTPPSTSTFQEFGNMDGMNDEALFLDVLNGDFQIPTSLQNNVSSTTEPDLAQGLAPSTPISEPLETAHMDLLEDEESIKQSGEDFSDAMRLCSEIHRRCQSRPLRLLTEADQDELAFMLGTIDELGKKTLGRSQVSCLTTPNRQDQYKWMIIRVAVVQAVEIAAELIEYNLRVTKSAATTPQHHPGHRPDELRAPLQNGTHGPDQSRIYLESVLSLCRLDYSLHYFQLFMSAQENPHEEYFPYSVSPGRDKSSSLVLGRVEHVRDQVWALASQLRHLWK